ncbi:thiol-disulfide oxidoreductase DCC family protein [Thermophagus sp. OGC60D27]|uniref:thiol-disulfide oxidoreductase DCC family protein n=1 Tax=Thermophagus sp. OGC60D27 TaxID=3458415 RepID=UPI004037BC59
MKPITVIFDGYCVLCSGFARWLKKRSGDSMSLISAQSGPGILLMHQLGLDLNNFDEVVVKTKEGSVLSGSSAILYILEHSGKTGHWCGRILKFFPSSFLKWGYRMVAKNRYQWFGRRATCTFIPD